MRLLRVLKKHGTYADKILKIAEIISGGDRIVTKEVALCVSNIRKFSAKYIQRYEARGCDIEHTNTNTLMWIGMTDCLIENGYAAELDWKCNKTDFIALLSNIRQFNTFGCEINPVLLYDDDDISSLCAAQDKVWYTKGLCVGGIDIESDSYVLFICSARKLEELTSLAQTIRHRIIKGKDL